MDWIDFTEKEKACICSTIGSFVMMLAEDPSSLAENYAPDSQKFFLKTRQKAMNIRKEFFGYKTTDEIISLVKDENEAESILKNMTNYKKETFINLLIDLYYISPNARYYRRLFIYKLCEQLNYNLQTSINL